MKGYLHIELRTDLAAKLEEGKSHCDLKKLNKVFNTFGVKMQKRTEDARDIGIMPKLLEAGCVRKSDYQVIVPGTWPVSKILKLVDAMEALSQDGVLNEAGKTVEFRARNKSENDVCTLKI